MNPFFINPFHINKNQINFNPQQTQYMNKQLINQYAYPINKMNNNINNNIELKSIEWKEVKTDNGSVFYYNQKLNSSIWEKPNELKSEEEKISGWNKQIGIDGKEYFYHPVKKLSVWNEPEEYTNAKFAIESYTINREEKEKIKENLIKDNINKDKILTKEEANIQFMELLKQMNITSTWTWEDTERILSNEENWRIVKTYQERKFLFNEYIKKKRIVEKEEEILKKEKARINFRHLLEEDNTITSNSDFINFYNKYYNDQRWRMIEDKEREDEFENYLDELERNQNEEREIILNTKLKLFKEILIKHKCNTKTKWNEILKDYPNVITEKISIIEKYEKLKTFNNYMDTLYKNELLNIEKKKEENSFLKREAFRDLITEDINNGIITFKTNWKEYFDILVRNFKSNSEDRFWNFIGIERKYSIITPRQIFEDAKAILKSDFYNNKKRFNEYLKSKKDYKELLKLNEIENLELVKEIIDKTYINWISESNIKINNKKIFLDEIISELLKKINDKNTHNHTSNDELNVLKDKIIKSDRKIFEINNNNPYKIYDYLQLNGYISVNLKKENVINFIVYYLEELKGSNKISQQLNKKREIQIEDYEDSSKNQ